MTIEVRVGDLVLLRGPPFWEGCYLRVEEIRGWGYVGVVTGPKQADYPLRVAVDDVAQIFRKVEPVVEEPTAHKGGLPS